MKNLKNVTLKKDLPVLLETKNIVSVKKTEYDLSNRFSIDVTEREPSSVSSYTYMTEDERNADLVILERIIKENK